ncbi:cell division protein FtsX [Anaerocolumna cellulosilytica]|uniref:Cell division protein FtsX n=1 Tax=Anaerocolumna cellulosilytica TaxID=433286 RepID=A0A6S6R1K8_9FIRM|nr:permease-like cell division protein FtsX [Anaerocolumna cellulosilytica]MBB5195786.1 cell division transport system permease protein [Anaerocolumna cellulosilytica]BCJ92878.1 cell division protein FtsX [Anaerocolumna cellulosilytica]
MRISTFYYSLKQGFKNIRRNRMFSLASIGTITACLFLFGIFYFVVSNFQYMIKTAETSVGVTVFFDKGINEDQIKKIGEEIKRRDEVNAMEYTSAEETWKNYKEKYLSKELAETFGDDNPLEDSASYTVYLKEVSSQAELVKYIEGMDGVRQVNHSDSVADTFKNFNALVGYVSAAIIIILLAVAIFLISTTVTMGISVRREEISIMKLIGATDTFIKSPFIVEGVIIGVMGAIVPLVVLYFMYDKLISYITERYINQFYAFQFLEPQIVFRTLIPSSLLIGIGIGFIGSYMTVRRHLRHRE